MLFVYAGVGFEFQVVSTLKAGFPFIYIRLGIKFICVTDKLPPWKTNLYYNAVSKELTPRYHKRRLICDGNIHSELITLMQELITCTTSNMEISSKGESARIMNPNATLSHILKPYL